MSSAMLKTIKRNARSYSLTSQGSESFVDGYVVKSTESDQTIKAHIQPMNEKELRQVPELQNTLQWIVIWSEISLPVKDKITYGGVIFTIQKVEFWDDGPFYRAKAVHVEE